MNYFLTKKLREAGYEGEFGLSELIAACVKLSVDGDFHVEHLNQGGDEDWGASVCWIPEEGHSDWFVGKDPETAVANLWLKLKNV